MNNDKLITTSGIIRNRTIPRVGVISQHSLNSEFLDEIITQGINLSYEDYMEECKAQGMTEEQLEEASEMYESQEDTYLYGDWVKTDKGYEIDKNGKEGFAVTYGSMGNVCVEWSKTTKLTHHTSPCYVMADGSGPCGDLDTKGDSVIAYALPDDCLFKE